MTQVYKRPPPKISKEFQKEFSKKFFLGSKMTKFEKVNVIENDQYRYYGVLGEEDRIDHKFLDKSTGEVYTLIQSPFYSFRKEDFELSCRNFERN